MTQDDQIRAERARQILEDEVVVLAFADMEQNIRDSMLAVDDTDADAVRVLVMQLKCLHGFRDALSQIIQRGSEHPARSGRFA